MSWTRSYPWVVVSRLQLSTDICSAVSRQSWAALNSTCYSWLKVNTSPATVLLSTCHCGQLTHLYVHILYSITYSVAAWMVELSDGPEPRYLTVHDFPESSKSCTVRYLGQGPLRVMHNQVSWLGSPKSHAQSGILARSQGSHAQWGILTGVSGGHAQWGILANCSYLF